MAQTSLPDDPLDNVGGSSYLRLTNDCPPNGILMQIHSVGKVHNEKFDRDEYNWTITHFTPAPIDKTMTESSPGFCTALKTATKGNYRSAIVLVKWVKTPMSGGRTRKDWSIRLASEEDVKKMVGA